MAFLILLAACTQAPIAASPSSPSVTPTARPSQPIAPTPEPTITITPEPQITPTPEPQITVTPEPQITPAPFLQNPPDEKMSQVARMAQANYRLLDEENTGVWRYDEGMFVHPIALEVTGDTAYLLDGGRVLLFDLAQPTPPELLLSPGDEVEGVPVIEPLDLALTAVELLVLDRAGDVYRYDLSTQVWSLARYDRPIGETSSHYYVALDDHVLVEPSYGFAMQFGPAQPDRFWLLPEGMRPVDVSATLTQTAVLLQDAATLTATVRLYAEATQMERFRPTVEMRQPRQVVLTDTAVYVLDGAGRRLLTLHPDTGALLAVTQLPSVSTFAVDGKRLILAGQNQLYFVDAPERWAGIAGGPVFVGSAPHDTAVWSALGSFLIPVQGSQVGARDLQLPGAPRHYRLGVHEGVDFYWGAGTPVWAAADGVVVRAMHEYEQADEEEFARRREELRERGYSTEEDLEFYRGMQVWIEHADGTVARYVHLSGIEKEVMEGTAVTAGQRIGLVGNTGSPLSLTSATEDAHLHFELWLNGHYLGQFLRPVEVRELVALLFREQ
ncbi:MAG: peptidoglycan DD-metalloendopeptidase family protein [Anaerolineae bacterium]|nr:peptidoglycan DD-metalloendopeptidase family protein [Anaerolineae bacterium]